MSWCTSERWNGLLSYETSRKTVIQHWVVGLIHWIFLILIAVYIFYFVMWRDQRYLKRYPVTGDFRYKIIPPNDGDRSNLKDLRYCHAYVKNSFEEALKNKRFMVTENNGYGTLVKFLKDKNGDSTAGKEVNTLERCRTACVRSYDVKKELEPKHCIGFNFNIQQGAENGKCYLIYRPNEEVKDIQTAKEKNLIEEQDAENQWQAHAVKPGRKFLYHVNVGNCQRGLEYQTGEDLEKQKHPNATSGLRKGKQTKFSLSSPPPGKHSGSFGIYLGFANRKLVNDNDKSKTTLYKCDDGPEECYANEYVYFPDIEKYSLEITHGYVTMEDLKRTNDDRLSMGSRKCSGKLVDQEGNTIKTFNDSGTTSNTRDHMTIKQILQAADIDSLDGACDGHDDDCKSTLGEENEHISHSFRNEGLVVYLRIEYSDAWDKDGKHMSYTYKFDRMEDTDWSIYTDEIRFTALRIPVIITGSVGEFNIMNLIVELTSCLFLLGVAEMFMVYVVFKFFPQKELYQRAVYQKTKPFEEKELIRIKSRKSSLWEDQTVENLIELADLQGLQLGKNEELASKEEEQYSGTIEIESASVNV